MRYLNDKFKKQSNNERINFNGFEDIQSLAHLLGDDFSNLDNSEYDGSINRRNIQIGSPQQRHKKPELDV